MYVYPGTPWGPLGLIISTYVKCLGQLKCYQYLLQSLLYGCTGVTGNGSWDYLELTPCIILEYLQKGQSVTLNKSETSNHTWEFTQLETRKRFCISEMLPFQECRWYTYTVYEVLHKIGMKRAGAKLGWWSNIFLIEAQTFIYFYIPYMAYFSKIYSTSVHFDSNFSVIQLLVYLE